MWREGTLLPFKDTSKAPHTFTYVSVARVSHMATAKEPRKCAVLVKYTAVPNKVKVLLLMREGRSDTASSSSNSSH